MDKRVRVEKPGGDAAVLQLRHEGEPDRRDFVHSLRPGEDERAHAAGADSFIYKDAPLDELEKVIRGTFEGGSFYPRPHASELNFDELTRREKEILRLICDGLSRKEICDALGITINSVKTHFANILSKTGYESVAKLAIYAVSHGFINTKIKP